MNLSRILKVSSVYKAGAGNMLADCAGAPVDWNAATKKTIKYFYANVIRQIGYILVAVGKFRLAIDQFFVGHFAGVSWERFVCKKLACQALHSPSYFLSRSKSGLWLAPTQTIQGEIFRGVSLIPADHF